MLKVFLLALAAFGLAACSDDGAADAPSTSAGASASGGRPVRVSNCAMVTPSTSLKAFIMNSPGRSAAAISWRSIAVGVAR